MRPRSTEALIRELVRSTGAADDVSAVRERARELVALYVSQFGELERPINVEVLASLRGIGRATEAPIFSDDAELVPDGSGGVKMRINTDRPGTRRRFSIAHEITHTFFPDYTQKVWCRSDARHRILRRAEDRLETLCDIGAAELIFPSPWFAADAARVQNAAGLVELARTYHASREATLRRYAEAASDSVAVAFFEWKLKPTQRALIGASGQTQLFGAARKDVIRSAVRLRIDYAVPSERFRSEGRFLPTDKSIDCVGPIHDAAADGVAADGELALALGPASGIYRVWAIPLWTAEDERGPDGESAVALVLRLVDHCRAGRKRRSTSNSRPLFGS